MQKGYVVVKSHKHVTRVEVSEIMYVLRDGRRLILATQSQEYIFYGNMDSVEGVVGKDCCRILARCIVNMAYLKSVDVERRRVIFKNGEELFLGRNACNRLKMIFYRYLLTNNLDEEAYIVGGEDVAEEEGFYKEKGLATR